MAQRLLGIDYGEQRIGIAASEGTIAVPVTILQHESRERDIERVAGLARGHNAERIIVGLPLLPSGDEGPQARRCRRFGEALARRTGLLVAYHDETLTTVAAVAASRETRGGGRPRRVDDLAAARILQSYLDGDGL